MKILKISDSDVAVSLGRANIVDLPYIYIEYTRTTYKKFRIMTRNFVSHLQFVHVRTIGSNPNPNPDPMASVSINYYFLFSFFFSYPYNLFRYCIMVKIMRQPWVVVIRVPSIPLSIPCNPSKQELTLPLLVPSIPDKI